MISITYNTFSYNSVVKGLIYIDLGDTRTKPVLIANNVFTGNAAYYGTIGVYIR